MGMDVVNFSEARKNLKQVMDGVCKSRRPVIITRRGGKHVVMVSLDDYNGMDETAYLLASKANARRLRESLRDIKSGKGKLHRYNSTQELMDELGI